MRIDVVHPALSPESPTRTYYRPLRQGMLTIARRSKFCDLERSYAGAIRRRTVLCKPNHPIRQDHDAAGRAGDMRIPLDNGRAGMFMPCPSQVSRIVEPQCVVRERRIRLTEQPPIAAMVEGRTIVVQDILLTTHPYRPSPSEIAWPHTSGLVLPDGFPGPYNIYSATQRHTGRTNETVLARRSVDRSKKSRQDLSPIQPPPDLHHNYKLQKTCATCAGLGPGRDLQQTRPAHRIHPADSRRGC